MQRFIRAVCLMLLLATGSCGIAKAQHALTWDEVKARFESDNPTLRAGKLGVDEPRAIDKAETDHRLAVGNGSTDPTLAFDVGRNPPIDQYLGCNVSVPLRIFDRNQGEKLRTQIDFDRNRRVADAARAQVYNDVDSAYATVNSTIVLLQPYTEMYLARAERVRDTVSFAYQCGGVSLLDFLDAQKEYRDTQLNYLNLIGSYLMAASQMNLAVGREVIQ